MQLTDTRRTCTEGATAPLEAAGGWVKPPIEEAMDRNRRPKPETMNATIQTECSVGGVVGIGFGRQVLTPRLSVYAGKREDVSLATKPSTVGKRRRQ